MEEGASPLRWALDKKLGEGASMEEKKEGEKSCVGNMVTTGRLLQILERRKKKY